MTNSKEEKIIHINFFVLIITILCCFFNLSFYTDDGLIYGRYLENFRTGNGLVFNPGEIYNALTSPLYTYLALALNGILQNTILSLNIVSSFFMVGTVYVMQSLLKEYGFSIAGTIGGALIAVTPFFYAHFTLETSLYSFLILASLFFYQKKNYFFLSSTLALLICTRSEGVFLLAALFLHTIFIRKYFPNLLYFLPALFILAFIFLLNYYFFESPIASTGNAKIYHGESGFWKVGFWFILFYGTVMLQYGISFLTIPFLYLGLKPYLKKDFFQIGITYAIFLLCFYIFLKLPAYRWYYAPFVLMTIFGAAIGFEILYLKNKKNFSIFKKNIVVGISLILLFLPPIYNINLGRDNHPYKETAFWLNKNTAADSKIAMAEIGIVGFFSDRYIIDILGLTSPGNAELIGQGDVKSWILKYPADYIIVHDPVWNLEEIAYDVLEDGSFENIKDFKVSGLNLLKRVDRPK